MITSKRTFGLEIEIDAKDNVLDYLQDAIGSDFSLVADSSIIGENPIEIVSNVLSLNRGETKVINLCKILNDIDVDPTGINSGLHVHLGASEFTNSQSSWELVEKEEVESGAAIKKSFNNTVMFASYRAIRSWRGLSIGDRLGNEDYLRFFNMAKNEIRDLNFITSLDDDILFTIRLENIQYFLTIPRKIYEKQLMDLNFEKTKAFLEHYLPSQLRGKYIIQKQSQESLTKLKNVLLTYIVFNDVISGMVPNSRKDQNSYCRKVSETYTVDEILAVKSISEFQMLWYLEENERNISEHTRHHYDNSRYQDINLHSIWNRTNTIEIRSHKSTIEPKLILNWVRFHQLIVDSVVDGKLCEATILPGTKLGMADQVLYLLDILEADESVRNYVKTLINHYNYLKL